MITAERELMSHERQARRRRKRRTKGRAETVAVSQTRDLCFCLRRMGWAPGEPCAVCAQRYGIDPLPRNRRRWACLGASR